MASNVTDPLAYYRGNCLDVASLPREYSCLVGRPAAFCRRCGLILPYAWRSPGACLCPSGPDPAVLVPVVPAGRGPQGGS